jgi:hypothetical protein
MRDLILKIHMYGGLLCSSYLILFGLSSLNYNHRFAFTEPGAEKVFYERTVLVPDIQDNKVLSAAIRDSLGLMGYPLPWETRRDTSGALHFGLARPGKKYTLHAFPAQNLVKVEENRRGYWEVVRQLHGLTGLPSSRFMGLWGVYTETCTWVVLFSAASGVYLWTARRSERRVGWALVGGAVGGSLLLMLYVLLWG